MKKALFLIFSSIMFFVNSDAKYILENNTGYTLKIAYDKFHKTKRFHNGSSIIKPDSKGSIGKWEGTVFDRGGVKITVTVLPDVSFDIFLKRDSGISSSYKFKLPSFSHFKTFRQVESLVRNKGYRHKVGEIGGRRIVLTQKLPKHATEAYFILDLE